MLLSRLRPLFLFLVLLLIGQVGLGATCSIGEQIEGEYILRLKKHSQSHTSSALTKVKSFSSKFRALDSSRIKSSRNPAFATKALVEYEPRVYLVELSDELHSQFQGDDRVESLEPNCLYELQAVESNSVPNDPLLSSNDSLDQVDLWKAWSIVSEASNLKVAIIDTGVDLSHPDLSANLWINPVEADGLVGVDDDSNGVIDDIHGVDIAELDGNPSPGTWAGAEHGTHVAGIIGAQGNNSIGISGVAWSTQLMPIKVFSDDSKGASLADIIQGIYYAVDNGADFINISLGSKKVPSAAETEAYRYAFDNEVVVVVAAGNNAEDSRSYSPGNIQGVLTVGSINSKDQLSLFSNYGNHVDILAPGGETNSDTRIEEFIFSTLPASQGGYGGLRGTSMAAPYVTGALMLMKAFDPTLEREALMNQLIQGGDFIEVEENDYFKTIRKYPRLNVYKSLMLSVTEKDCTNEVWCKSSVPTEKLSTAIKEKPTMPGGCQLSNAGLVQQKASTNLYLIFLMPLVLLGFRRRRN